MKTYLKIIYCALMIISLCACSMNKTDENTTTNNTTSNTTITEQSSSTNIQTTTNAVADPIASFENYSRDKVVWGPGNIENHEQPVDPKSLQQTFGELDASWLIGDDKRVLLTFDEGYENGFTPSILDTLREKKVKAVFFVTYDFASANPELIKRMIAEGHEIGNHTWHHYTMDEVDDDTAKEEVMYLHRYMQDEYNYTMSYFRFPKGEFSQNSLSIVKELGYKSVFWSFAYADWDTENQPTENEALQKICESTHNGEIILLHAVSEVNANVLGKAIDDIRKQGYDFA